MAAAASLAQTSSPVCPSQNRHYSLRLEPIYAGPSKPSGVAIKVQINDLRPLRLLLDSGSQDVVLSKRIATKLGLSGDSPWKLVGLGPSIGNATRLAPAKLQIGDLVLQSCPVLVGDAQMREGTDGVLPLSVFADFLVRLDASRKTLELDPYPRQPSDDAAYTSARDDHHMLFVEGTMNGAAGYLLLDTGAAYSGISPAAARDWRNYRMLAPSISLVSGGGETDGFLLPSGVRFQVGAQVMNADPAVVVDLSAISRLHRFEVSGVIGYPALQRSVVTVDYRSSRVRVENR